MKTEVRGKFNHAVVMTDQVEQECVNQLKTLCSQEVFKDSKIRIMPDCHAGKGCVVGFTATVKDKIIPNLVGVDISCSISTYRLNVRETDFSRLDEVIRAYVPSGRAVRENISALADEQLRADVARVCREIGDEERLERHLCSIGSLGGGNHFLEINRDKEGFLWLSVHCGSRNFGKQICEFHQAKAIETYKQKVAEGREKGLSEVPSHQKAKWLKAYKEKCALPKELCYLEGNDLDLYVEHMKVAEVFARRNHEVIVDEICSHMGWRVEESIFTHHNYIEFTGKREMVIRKGAISAQKGERVIIPLNMRDGSLIGVGKGNPEWNCSAPHGAGRVLSRIQARKTLDVDEFRQKMQNVWSSCVGADTLDESPMAYKDMQVIIDAIGETVEITDRIVPLYNFKASEAID